MWIFIADYQHFPKKYIQNVYFKWRIFIFRLLFGKNFRCAALLHAKRNDKHAVYNFAPKARKKSGGEIPHTGKYQ